jgi:hypothetical protein
MAMPYCVIKDVSATLPRHYPFSPRNIPHGIVAFLDRVNVGGTILNYPSIGGYLEWALSPRYKIGMDLQTPFLFTDNDLYLTQMALHDPKFMRLIVSRYHPDFIAASMREPETGKVLASFRDYVPVFFDDTSVLFTDAKRHPDLARDYAWPGNPWSPPQAENDAPLKEGQGCSLPPFLSREFALDAHIFAAQSYAAALCAAHKNFREELSYAKAMLQDYPEEPLGYMFKGSALRQLGDPAGAMAALRQGMSASGDNPRSDLKEEISKVFLFEKRYEKALDWARDANHSLPPRSWTWPKMNDAPAEKPRRRQPGR